MNSKIVIDFLARTEGLRKGTGAVVGQLDTVQRTTKRVQQALFGAGIALGGTLGLMSKKAADFEQRMQNVNSIVQDTDKVFAETSKSVLDLATKVPQSANKLAEGAYAVASAGFTRPKQMTDILAASGKAASAGLTDVMTASTAIVTAMNAYGAAAGNATRVSDLLFQTVNVGQVSFEQLAVNLGDFIGIANAAGGTLAESLSAYASITVATGQASRSATSLQGVYRAFIKPSEAMTQALNQVGFASGKQAIQALGLQGTLEALTGTVNNNEVAIAQIFQDVEGLNGVLALTGPNAEKARMNLAKFMDESVIGGATQKALAEQSKSFNYQLEQLQTTLGAVGVEFGQTFLPVMKLAVSALGYLARGLHNLPGPVKALLSVLAGVSSILMTVGLYAMLLHGRLKLVAAGFNLVAGTGVATKLVAVASSSKVAAVGLLFLQRVTGMTGASLLTMGKAAGVALLALLAIGPVAEMITDKLVPQNIDAMTDALFKWGETGSYSASRLTEKFGPGLTDLGGKIENFTNKANKIGVGSFDFTVGTAKSVREVDELDKAFSKLVNSGNINQAKAQMKMIEDSLLAQRDANGNARLSQKDLNQAFNDYYKAIGDVEAQNRATGDSQFELAAGAESVGDAIKRAEEEAKVWEDRLKSLQQQAQEFTSLSAAIKNVEDTQRASFDTSQKAKQEMDKQKAKAEQMSEAQEKMAKAQQKVNDLQAQGKDVTTPGTEGYDALAAAQDEVADSAGRMRDSQAEANEEFQKTPATMAQITAAITANLENYKQFQSNLQILALRGLPIEFIKELQGMGIEGTEIAASLASATPEEFEKVKGVVAEKVRVDSETYQREMEIQLATAAAIARRGAASTAQAILEEVGRISPGIKALIPEISKAMGDLGAPPIDPASPLGQMLNNGQNFKEWANRPAPVPTGGTPADVFGFGGRAAGGPVSDRKPVWVGENRRRELFVPEGNGKIFTERQARNIQATSPSYVLNAGQSQGRFPAKPTAAANMSTVSHVTHHNYRFGDIKAQDLTGAMRQADQKKRLQALVG